MRAQRAVRGGWDLLNWQFNPYGALSITRFSGCSTQEPRRAGSEPPSTLPQAFFSPWDMLTLEISAAVPTRRYSTHPLAIHKVEVDDLHDRLRSVMRDVPHAVVVCTGHGIPVKSAAATTSSEKRSSVPIGITLSSFTSLSIPEPDSGLRPLVSFNILNPSSTAQSIEKHKAFLIHILTGDRAGAEIANVYRQGMWMRRPSELRRQLAEVGCDVVSNWWRPPAADRWVNMPMLHGPGVQHVLGCWLPSEPQGGVLRVRDHSIIVGEVVTVRDDRRGLGRGDRTPALAYVDRTFRQPGDIIDLTKHTASPGQRETKQQ